MTAPSYTNTSGHPQTLANGNPVEPEATCHPDLEQPHDKALVDDGALVLTKDLKAKTSADDGDDDQKKDGS